MVLVLFTSLFSMVSFATVEPNVVAEYSFSSSTESWSLFSGDWDESLTLMQGENGGEDKCLAIEEHTVFGYRRNCKRYRKHARSYCLQLF